MNRKDQLSDINMNDYHFLKWISDNMLTKINKSSTIAFNNLLQEMNLCEFWIYPLTFELLAYSLKNVSDALEFVNELDKNGVTHGYELTEDNNLMNFFEYLIYKNRKLETGFQKLYKKITEKQGIIYSLIGEKGEFLFLESGSVTGGIRLLVFPEEVMLLTLSGYD